MELIDNISSLLGDSLKRSIVPGSKLKIAASCFSISTTSGLSFSAAKTRKMFTHTMGAFSLPGEAGKLKE